MGRIPGRESRRDEEDYLRRRVASKREPPAEPEVVPTPVDPPEGATTESDGKSHAGQVTQEPGHFPREPMNGPANAGPGYPPLHGYASDVGTTQSAGHVGGRLGSSLPDWAAWTAVVCVVVGAVFLLTVFGVFH